MSAIPRRVVVAEYAASALKEGELALFSTEAGASPAAFTQAEVRALSPAYSALYQRLIDELAPLLEAQGLPRAAARTFLRDAVPSVTHLVLDRALRLDRLVSALGAEGLAVRAAVSRPVAFARASVLRGEASTSRELNEAVLGRLAPALGLAVVDGAPAALAPSPLGSGLVNYNFEGRGVWSKLKGRAARLAAKLLPGRVPALSLAYASFVLQDEGFFGFGGLENVRGRASFPESAPQAGRRTILRSALLERLPLLEEFLRRAGARVDVPALASACAGLMAEAFPADDWEGAPAHHAAAAALLEGFEPTTLMLTETGNAEATAVIAAARGRGFQTIGVQDGGHYGYMDDVVSVVEGEFPHFDRYLTWGWTRFPEGSGLGGVTAEPLPSPWLSEKQRQWRRVLGGGEGWWEAPRPHDLLLMPNRVNPFPPAPSGAAVSRSDHSPAVAAELKDLVARSKAAGVKVLFKPYNATTMRLLAGTLDELRALGGDCFAQVERADKGLHAGLVSRARMTLWDQPGTGFLECLVAGLPTMVVWTRLYNHEAPWAKEYFAQLEEAGLVHRDAASMLAEYARFKAAPAAWMRDARRVGAANAFLKAYAGADDAWTRPWRARVRAACFRR